MTVIMTDYATCRRGCMHERVWTFEQQELDALSRIDPQVC